MAGPTGIEPATYGLRVRRSDLAELRAHIFAFRNEPVLGNLELSVSLSFHSPKYYFTFEMLKQFLVIFSAYNANQPLLLGLTTGFSDPEVFPIWLSDSSSRVKWLSFGVS